MKKNKLVILAAAVLMMWFALATQASATPFSGISGLDNGTFDFNIETILGSNESSVSLFYEVGDNVTEALSSGILFVKDWNLVMDEWNIDPYWSVLTKTTGTLGDWHITSFLLQALNPEKADDGKYNLLSTMASVDDTQYPFGVVGGQFTGTAGSVLTMDCGWTNISNATAAPVPEPATLTLLGFGLLGLAGYGRKKHLN